MRQLVADIASFEIPRDGKRPFVLEALREVVALALTFTIAYLAERYASPRPEFLFDQAGVVLRGTLHQEYAYPSSWKLGFRTELWTEKGKPTNEEMKAVTDAQFAAREKRGRYDKLLLIRYWPDIPAVKYRISEGLPQDLGEPPREWTWFFGGPTVSHSDAISYYSRSLIGKLPADYQVPDRKLEKGEFNEYLWAGALTASVAGLIIGLVVFSFARIFGVDTFYYTVTIGLLPVVLFLDYWLDFQAREIALASPSVAAALWLTLGVGIGIALRIAKFPRVGDYVIARHLPFVFVVVGLRADDPATPLLFAAGAVISSVFYFFWDRRSRSA